MNKKMKKKLTKDLMTKVNFMQYKINNILFKTKKLKNKLDFKQNYKKISLFIQKKPYTSFFGVLGIFLILMIIGNLVFSIRPETQLKNTAPKLVAVYKLGKAPTVTFQGKVEKSGVIKIVAQTPGIVSQINVSQGQWVNARTNILSLSSNYQGGNSLSIARQITQKQYENTKDTYSTQGDIIGRQKDIANKNHDNILLLQKLHSSR
jgi:multidrug efflux pump subunit AcrA (membrane-fusion protein)